MRADRCPRPKSHRFSPVTVCVRGPSRSGKTALCEALIDELNASGLQVAYLKRSHHELDLPHKASGRIWTHGPAAMVLNAADRLQLTLPRADGSAESLLALLPAGIDVALFETHSPEAYPTFLAECLDPADGEQVIGRWSMETTAALRGGFAELVRALLPNRPGRNLQSHPEGVAPWR